MARCPKESTTTYVLPYSLPLLVCKATPATVPPRAAIAMHRAARASRGVAEGARDDVADLGGEVVDGRYAEAVATTTC